MCHCIRRHYPEHIVKCFSELPDSPPQVVMELNNLDSYEATVARFKCKFQGKPEPTVKW